jgi:hypothetical protein
VANFYFFIFFPTVLPKIFWKRNILSQIPCFFGGKKIPQMFLIKKFQKNQNQNLKIAKIFHNGKLGNKNIFPNVNN